MTIETSGATARLLRAIRFAMLGLVSVGVAHDAIFAAQYGFGGTFARAMQAGGHDGYWPIFSTIVVVAATVLGLRAAVRLGRTHPAEAGGRVGPPAPSSAGPERGYRRELVGLWSALFVVVTAVFTVQENIEHLVGHGHLIGLGALSGPEYPLALPVIGLVSLIAAMLGALVRWRIAVLTARHAGRHSFERPPRRPIARRPAARWADIAALGAHSWFLVRLDAGRAPPPPA
jgi:hypothetical protein